MATSKWKKLCNKNKVQWPLVALLWSAKLIKHWFNNAMSFECVFALMMTWGAFCEVSQDRHAETISEWDAETHLRESVLIDYVSRGPRKQRNRDKESVFYLSKDRMHMYMTWTQCEVAYSCDLLQTSFVNMTNMTLLRLQLCFLFVCQVFYLY